MPSSFITSQITPAGVRPARRARSTLASVWPVRSRTPPSLARSGNMWPGTTMSRGAELGIDRDLDRVSAVVGRDAGADALRLASIVTVKAVCSGASFLAAIRLRPSASQRSAVSARQIRPARLLGHEVDRLRRGELGGHRQVALVLAVLVVADDDHPPAADLLDRLLDRRERALPRLGSRVLCPLRLGHLAHACSFPSPIGDQPLHVLRNDVALDVQPAPRRGPAQGRALKRLGDQRDLEPSPRRAPRP